MEGIGCVYLLLHIPEGRVTMQEGLRLWRRGWLADQHPSAGKGTGWGGASAVGS